MAEPGAPPAPFAPDPSDPAALALLRVLAASAVDAFIVTDLDARIQVWNGAAERLYGIDAVDAMGQVIYGLTRVRIVGDIDIPAWLPRQIALTSGGWHGRAIERPRLGRLQGHEVVVESTLSRLVDEAGRPVAVLNIKRDITPSYRLERELATLGNLVTATGQARSRAEIAQTSIDLLCTSTGADSGTIVRFDDEGATIVAEHGLNDQLGARIRAFADRSSPLFRASTDRARSSSATSISCR